MVIKLNYKIVFIVILILLILIVSIISMFNYSYADASNIEVSEGIRLPIIMYHQVKSTKLDKDTITPFEFESDLKYLKENNYTTITMSELISYVYDDIKLPEKPIMLTFDDGYLTTYKYVYPLLKEYDMKIVLSIIGKGTEDFSKIESNNSNYAHITWDQIKEVSDSGHIEIQNHTYNLHSTKGRVGCAKRKYETTLEYEKMLSEDLELLQEKISQVTGKTPTTFVYPFGKISEETNAILIKLGFKASLLCDGRINYINKNPNDLFGLKRIRRAHGKSISKLI